MKLNTIKSVFVLGLIAILGLNACNNDLDVYAPVEDITIIYGLLNPDSSRHYIKINRVFQGDGAIADLAKDRTLSEYENLNGRVTELEVNGSDSVPTGREWVLQESLITNKDSGVFYYPEQKIYYFDAKLDSTKVYKIQVDKEEGGKTFSSSEVIASVRELLIKPVGLNFIGLGLAGTDEPNDDIPLEITMPINAKIVDVYLDFSWRDEYIDGTFSEVHTLSYKVGTYVTTRLNTDAQDTRSVKGRLNGFSFYSFLAANIDDVLPGSNIKQRIPTNPDFLGQFADFPLTFRMVTGGTEFHTYIEVTTPSTSILETKPDYTNIRNGIGLFNTRKVDLKLSKMSNNSIEYLVNGEIMVGKNFCHYSNSTSPQSCY